MVGWVGLLMHVIYCATITVPGVEMALISRITPDLLLEAYTRGMTVVVERVGWVY